MEDAPPRNPLSIARVVLLVFSGYLLGTVIGGIVAFPMPVRYSVKARIEDPSHAGHEPKITRLRAEMIVRQMDLENRWQTGFDKAAQEVTDLVTLHSNSKGVEVEVRYSDPRDTLRLADAVASSLDTPRREKELAAKFGHLGPIPEADRKDALDLDGLDSSLHTRLEKAGFSGGLANFLSLPADDPKVRALAEDVEFHRKLARMKELSARIGYYSPPGEPFLAANPKVELGELPTRPVSPNIPAWLAAGGITGVVLSGLAILALNRRKSAYLYPQIQQRRPRVRVSRNDDPW